MSRVYFHSPSGDAALRGSERAHLAHVAQTAGVAALELDDWDGKNAVALVSMMDDPKGRWNYLRRDAELAARQHGADVWVDGVRNPRASLIQSLKTSLAVGGFDMKIDGFPVHSLNLILNTAVVAGSDPMKLAAKIHGWCESHAWVDGPDRAWLADVIDEGLADGIYRRRLLVQSGLDPDSPLEFQSQGWEDVQKLLRIQDDEPVVMPYSVCEQFPNPYIADWEPPVMPDGWEPEWVDDEASREEWLTTYPGVSDRAAYYRDEATDQGWDKFDHSQGWELAMAGLKKRRPWAQISPETLGTVFFGPKVSAYDLHAEDRAARLTAAFVGYDIGAEE